MKSSKSDTSTEVGDVAVIPEATMASFLNGMHEFLLNVASADSEIALTEHLDRKQLDFSAKNSLAASLHYVKAVTSGWNLTSTLDVQMRDRRFIDGTNLYPLPSYWNADLNVGVENKSYSFVLFVTNLSDNRKPNSAQATGDTYSLQPPTLVYTAYPADPRQIGIRLSAKF